VPSILTTPTRFSVRSMVTALVLFMTCTFLTLLKKTGSRTTPTGVDISSFCSLTTPET